MINKIYKILDLNNYQYIENIGSAGFVIFSPNGKSFMNHSDAYSFLITAMHTTFNNGRFIDMKRFNIVEISLTPVNNTPMEDYIARYILDEPDTEKNIKYLTIILKEAVNNGFGIIDPTLFEFIKSYDKYKPILNQIIPHHMLNAMDDFMTCGILECDLDILGIISLTATTEQFIMFDIEGIFSRRT